MFKSSRPAETHALARQLAADAHAGEVWALVGDLGAGKTHFVQGIAAGLDAPGPVTSPTFTLVHEYPGGRLPLYHFDFYRLRTADELLALGWEEYADGDGLTVVEWADKFPELLPPARAGSGLKSSTATNAASSKRPPLDPCSSWPWIARPRAARRRWPWARI